MVEDVEPRTVSEIGNHYGGLSIARFRGICYWIIDGVGGESWEVIPASLFDELAKLPSYPDRVAASFYHD